MLRAIPAAQRGPNFVTLLRREVAETLAFDDPESVPVDRNFYEIGMDSLMMADLVSRLKKRLGTSYSALVFDHPNVRSLAIELIQQLPLEEAPTPAPPALAASPPLRLNRSPPLSTGRTRPSVHWLPKMLVQKSRSLATRPQPNPRSSLSRRERGLIETPI